MRVIFPLKPVILNMLTDAYTFGSLKNKFPLKIISFITRGSTVNINITARLIYLFWLLEFSHNGFWL